MSENISVAKLPVQLDLIPLRPAQFNVDCPIPSDPPTKPKHDNSPARCGKEIANRTIRSIPHVQLDTDCITAAMAARLASSLLGHVLFLKSQIPFPVAQLSRISTIRKESKAAKQRSELVFAVDTLTSHLQTTFTALSSAFAERERKNCPEPTNRDRRIPTSRAYMMFVLGPSVGAAKAKIALVADGLEAQLWDDKGGLALVNAPENRSVDSPTGFSGQSDIGEDDSGAESGDASEDGEVDEWEVVAEGFEYANVEQPPPSRSPSPSSPSLSRPASPLLEAPKPAGLSLLSASESALRNHARRMPPPLRTQAEEEERLRSADRLLSRTLANACAADDGGMSCELAATQTHVLLRAPRRFDHPSWVPRQNLTRSLESTLCTFLEEVILDAHQDSAENEGKKKPSRHGVRTEGVWISCRTPGHQEEIFSSESDELIWWQWDGKIVGFSGW